MREILTINELDYSIGDHTILNQVSLTVQEGEVLTLIGPNGCGKSTLLKLADGLLAPSAKTSMDQHASYNARNQILLYDRPLGSYSRKELARLVSVLPQSRNVPSISVQRLVEHGRFPHLDLSRHLSGTDHTIINEALDTMNLSAYRNKELPTLSGGERQRAYIAMALAQDTPIIYMDEPTTYLDISYQYELLRTIQELNQNRQKTILMVLHDIGLALKFSDRIAVMEQGQILFTGTPSQVISSGILSQVFHITCTPVTIDGVTDYLIRG